jgi:transcriptional regulator with XRE-family HTH domain
MNKIWFKEKLKALKMSQRQLGKKIGLDPAAVSYMFQGKRSMSMDDAKAIADVFMVPVTEIMRQAGIDVVDDVRKVPIAGHIGPDFAVSLLPKGTHDTIIAPADVPSGSFALQMRAVNTPRDGWIYFVSGSHLEPAECMDKLSVAALKDGSLILGAVKRGYKQGLFNLVVMSSPASVLENKEVVWAAKVLWILPT